MVPIFVEHWGDNLQFYPNFALFSTLGGMNLDHDSKKKMQTEHFFSPNSGEDQKKRSSSKIEHFFSPNFCSDLHPFKILGGMRMWIILKLLGGIQPNYWGDISPHPPRVSAPLFTASLLEVQQLKGQCEAFILCGRQVGRRQLDSKTERSLRYLLAKATWWIKCKYNYNCNYNSVITFSLL